VERQSSFALQTWPQLHGWGRSRRKRTAPYAASVLPNLFCGDGLADFSLRWIEGPRARWSRGTQLALEPKVSTRAATHCRALSVSLFVFLWLCTGPRAIAEVRWRSVPTHGTEFGLTAVAFDPASDRIAAGSTRGLYKGDASGVFDLVAGRSEVRDLAFLAAGAGPSVLFAATSRGVYRIAAEGTSGPLAPGPGGGARDVYRIAVAARGAGFAVATAGGAFFSPCRGRTRVLHADPRDALADDRGRAGRRLCGADPARDD